MTKSPTLIQSLSAALEDAAKVNCSVQVMPPLSCGRMLRHSGTPCSDDPMPLASGLNLNRNQHAHCSAPFSMTQFKM